MKEKKRTHLTKDMFTQTLDAAWAWGQYKKITGHLFWFGGTSLGYSIGVKPAEIFLLGCWTSVCYKIYIRPYSKEEADEAVALIKQLDNC
jgi:hypothetical protein